MIRDLVNNRYSARIWLDNPIEQEKIDYIIECAFKAPSKQSLYPWTMFVLGEDPKAKEFKNWLFWEDTWCYKGERAKPAGKHSNDKRFNGQYRAPLLLLWAHRDLNPEQHKDQHYWEHYWPYAQQQNLVDMTTSASFALLAAEELGLRTCFGRCHSWEYTDTVLGEGRINVDLALGIGYAEEHDYSQNLSSLWPVERNGRLEGYDTRNLDQNYPNPNHYRSKKPPAETLIKYIK